MIEIWILSFLVIFICLKSFRKPKNLPPGTFGLPVLGYLPSPKEHMSTYIRQMQEKYGNIFTTKWGQYITVFLADPVIVRTAFNMPELQERPDYDHFKLFPLPTKTLGVIFNGGERHKTNRRFLIFHLKNMGMGKSYIEESIMKEAQMVVDCLGKSYTDKPVQLDRTINLAILNIVWQMIASKRYDEDDEFMKKFIFQQAKLTKIAQGNMMITNYFPWIKRLLPTILFEKFINLREALRYNLDYRALFEIIIKDHRETFNPENPRDIIDHYLLDGVDKDDELCDDLIGILWDMFVAGSDTTSNTIRWIILYMAIHPKIQHKLQSHIDSVVPRERLPSLDDRAALPYVEAVYMEALRTSSFAHVGLPHVATSTVKVGEYTIPEGAMLFGCLEMCHKNPKYWEKPNEFYPEHFLDSEGKLTTKNEAFMPFGLGKRQCLGMALAKSELFLFSSAILQKFTIECVPGKIPSDAPVIDQFLFNCPEPYEVILRKR